MSKTPVCRTPFNCSSIPKLVRATQKEKRGHGRRSRERVPQFKEKGVVTDLLYIQVRAAAFHRTFCPRVSSSTLFSYQSKSMPPRDHFLRITSLKISGLLSDFLHSTKVVYSRFHSFVSDVFFITSPFFSIKIIENRTTYQFFFFQYSLQFCWVSKITILIKFFI